MTMIATRGFQWEERGVGIPLRRGQLVKDASGFWHATRSVAGVLGYAAKDDSGFISLLENSEDATGFTPLDAAILPSGVVMVYE